MDALKLNTDAIRERMSKAVVVKFDGEIDVIIPLYHHYSTESAIHPGCKLKANHVSLADGKLTDVNYPNIDWIIRPGDECEMSDDGREWYRDVFKGVNWSSDQWDMAGSIFATDSYSFMGTSVPYTFIRPVPKTSPEKVRIQESADRMEKELAELNRRIEQID